jgi:type II secretory pathway pseudopilin PulG
MSLRGRSLPANAGMTLLEILIASGIMATALVLVMSSLANIDATGETAGERSLANSHATSVLEELRGTDQVGLLLYRPPVFRGLRGETITVQYVGTAGNLVTVPMAASSSVTPIPNPTEIRVTVRWQTKSGHPHREVVSTFMRW